MYAWLTSRNNGCRPQSSPWLTSLDDPNSGAENTVPATERTLPSPALIELAHAYGVSTEYHGWLGELVEISDETLRAVLTALGADVETEDAIAGSLQDLELRPWRRVLPPTVVCRSDDGPWVPVHLPHGSAVRLWIELESGDSWNVSLADRWVEPRDIDGALVGEATAVIPSNVPLGWHRLVAELQDGTQHSATLIVTPRSLPLHPAIENSRVWGLMSSTRRWQVTSLPTRRCTCASRTTWPS